MPWHVETKIHANAEIIECTYSGVLAPAELLAAVHAAIETGRHHAQPRALTDCRLLAGGHSIFDLYALADILQASAIGKDLREAVLVSELPDAAEKVAFWETTCANRGLNVRIFTDRDEALDWLLRS